MDEIPQIDLPTSPEKLVDDPHIGREKKITDPTIARLLRSARRMVEERTWGSGMIWYPNEMLRRISPSELAEQVLPDTGTPTGQACARVIGGYAGKSLTEQEARCWLAEEIDKRLGKYVIGARDKIDEVRLVVTEHKIRVRAERPDTTRKTVGPAPWATRL
jgi:hypothetical protein